ncbi:hypothetical protein [Tissierella pigra]|uniref:Uncharacterized protein n=1 Tax=Tissierella pigra TaxID=2607614 RepID=A0A6N7XDM1_9FIRM|nr:hypothetical protein [Tissierella pigra]MSU00129.1 hypothetical protein [Tissierella pigra]
MIDISSHSIFEKNKSSLKETSKDDADKRNIKYMTHSEFEVIDFDGVKNDYIKGLKLGDTPKSNDVLCIINNELYFIEFKNGNMKKEIHKVKRKIFDSLLIFTDIISKGISHTRKDLNYILVYNKDYRPNPTKKLDKDEVQESKELDKFISLINKHGRLEPDPFELSKQFKNLYFKKVYTYTAEEFEEKFVNEIEE